MKQPEELRLALRSLEEANGIIREKDECIERLIDLVEKLICVMEQLEKKLVRK